MKIKKTSIMISPDLCPINRIDVLCNSNNYKEIYNDYIQELNDVDYRVVNLELPITDNLDPIEKRGPVHSVGSKHIEHIKYAGFDLLTLANNHIRDHGDIGLKNTIDHIKSNGLNYVGAGENIDKAKKKFYSNINGIRVAFVNFTENEFSIADENRFGANPLNIIDNYNSIKEAKSKSDCVIVIIHGGHEGYRLPSKRMVSTYKFFVDSGADIVVSHHSHCFSGYEIYKEKPIFYGLGNFIFDKQKKINQPWNYGFSVKLNIVKKDTINCSFELIPYKQCNGDQIGVHKLSRDEEDIFCKEIEELNNIIKSSDLLEDSWNKFTKQRTEAYLNHLEPFDNILVKVLRRLRIMPRLLSSKKRQLILNLIRCEAHRDILIESLKEKF